MASGEAPPDSEEILKRVMTEIALPKLAIPEAPPSWEGSPCKPPGVWAGWTPKKEEKEEKEEENEEADAESEDEEDMPPGFWGDVAPKMPTVPKAANTSQVEAAPRKWKKTRRGGKKVAARKHRLLLGGA